MTASINETAPSGSVTTPIGAIVLSNTDGSDINVAQKLVTRGTGASGTGLGNIAGSVATPVTTQGKVTLTDSVPVTSTEHRHRRGSAALGRPWRCDAGGQSISLPATTSTLANQDVLTVADANSTISSVDAALATVSAFQSQLGAIQNRFTAAVSNLQSTSQNLTQSRSTIEDANFAQETANLTQAQVLEQAGISVLAQANQEPQLILQASCQ